MESIVRGVNPQRPRELEGDGCLSARHVAEHSYCPRLFYLEHVEGVFLHSADTEQGRFVHARVDKPGFRSVARGDVEAGTAEEPKRVPQMNADDGDGEPAPGGEGEITPVLAPWALLSGDEPEPQLDCGAGFQPAQSSEPEKAAEGRQAPPARTTNDQRPVVARSLTITDRTLGLIGVMDLVEFDVMSAVPVEYRKGRPRKARRQNSSVQACTTQEGGIFGDEPPPPPEVEPWPADRLQLGLQVLLLEGCGFTVPRAEVYYASERRRIVVEVDDALRNEAKEMLKLARITAAQRTRPAPLIASPKCPRCSLQPVCLPDELNHQRITTLTVETRRIKDLEELTPRKIWPPRDDGLHIVAQTDGVHVGVRGECLRFSDGDGKLVRDMPLANVESVLVLGGVQLSTQAIGVLADRQVPVAFATRSGRLLAMIDPLGPVSHIVRVGQVRTLDSVLKSLQLAKAVVVAKIENQRTLLMRNALDLPGDAVSEMAASAGAAANALTHAELMGHEGNAARVYFQHFPLMIKDPQLREGFAAHGRKRRPAPDPVNAALSLGYSVLSGECTTALRLASLEPTIGALHSPRPGRPALALDLMEPFRPLVVDSAVITALNRGELVPGHFINSPAGTMMTDHGRRSFFGCYGRRMDHTVRHPVFEYRLSYRRMLMLHARLIAAWCVGEVRKLDFLTTR